MKWRFVLVGMLLMSTLVVMAAAQPETAAKLPEVGDMVVVITPYTGLGFLWMAGNVTAQDDSTICIDCIFAEIGNGDGRSSLPDTDFLGNNCLGKSSYLILKIVPDEHIGEVVARADTRPH
mgnify:FL=1